MNSLEKAVTYFFFFFYFFRASRDERCTFVCLLEREERNKSGRGLVVSVLFLLYFAHFRTGSLLMVGQQASSCVGACEIVALTRAPFPARQFWSHLSSFSSTAHADTLSGIGQYSIGPLTALLSLRELSVVWTMTSQQQRFAKYVRLGDGSVPTGRARSSFRLSKVAVLLEAGFVAVHRRASIRRKYDLVNCILCTLLQL